jgi:putative ABC transport system substrate-binding protein
LVTPGALATATHADPVGIGHVASLARPGGNITGLSMLLTELVAKELEILTEVVPQAKRIAVLWNPTTPSLPPAMKAVDAAGERVSLQLIKVPAQASDDFDGAFALMARERVEAVLVWRHRRSLLIVSRWPSSRASTSCPQCLGPKRMFRRVA